jgi:hypothetical protein
MLTATFGFPQEQSRLFFIPYSQIAVAQTGPIYGIAGVASEPAPFDSLLAATMEHLIRL